MLRVLKQRTHFDLQLPEYCIDSADIEEERSDAPYQSPFYPVMSLETNSTTTTDISSRNDANGLGVGPLYPGYNSHHNNFYLKPPTSAAPAAVSATLTPHYNGSSPQQPNRLKHTEEAIYQKILREAGEKSGENTAEEPDEASAEEKVHSTEGAANENKGEKEEVMTNHNQFEERLSEPTDTMAPPVVHSETMPATTSDLDGDVAETGRRSSSPVAVHGASDDQQQEPPVAEKLPGGAADSQQPVDTPSTEAPAHCVERSQSSDDKAPPQMADDKAPPQMADDKAPPQMADDNSNGKHDDHDGEDFCNRENEAEQPNAYSEGATPCTTTGSPGGASYRGITSPGDAGSESLSPVTRGPPIPSPSDSVMSSPFPRGPPPLLIAPQFPDGAPEMAYPSVGGPVNTPSKVPTVVYGMAVTPDGALSEGGCAGDNGELFYCHLCTYVGMSKDHFTAHMNSHFEHSCPYCDYSSRTEGRLKRHIKDFHSETPPDTFAGNKNGKQPMPAGPRQKIFRCRQCDFVADEKVDFWEHSRTHIKSDKILQCPKCPFVTEYKHHLEYHLRNHFGSKPFKCQKCNYACVNKSMLNSHMKSHTNVYQYRCADCTYATKYCHSLKLHLKKYSHMPATVLNTDGSLPTDGSGDFELVSKRGPPRGPRGPKKEAVSPTAGSMLGPQPGLGHSPMNGTMFGPNFWPLNGLQPPPPLIPVSGMSPLSIPSMPPQEVINKVSGMPPGGQHPNQQPQQQQQQQQQRQQANDSTTPTSHMPLKCNFCPFLAESYPLLSQHMLKVHSTENQDLLNAFGIQPDALTEKYMKPPGPQSEASTDPIYNAAQKQQIPDMTQTWAALHQLSNSAASIAASSVVQALKSNTTLEASRALAKETFSKPSMAVREPESAPKQQQQQQPGEGQGTHPLDLTKRRGARVLNEFPVQPPVSAPINFSPGMKRSNEDEGWEAAEAGGEGCSTPPSGTTSPTPRKRSRRKGKAYKLDTLCMKLQGRYTRSPTLACEDANDEEYSDYSMGKDSDAVPDSGPGSAEPTTNGQDVGDRDDTVDYRELHNSLSVLNNGSSDQHYRQQLQTENDAGDGENMCVARRLEFGQEHTLPKSEVSKDGEEPAVMEEQNGKSTRRSMEGSFECHHCDISFRDCVMYTVHMGYHGYQDPFKCNMCGQQSSNKVEFFLHVARVAHE